MLGLLVRVRRNRQCLNGQGNSRTLVVCLRGGCRSRPPFPRPRRKRRRTISVRGRACIWCLHSRAVARPGCPRPGRYHYRHRRAGATIAPASGLPRGGLPDGLAGSSPPGRTSPVGGRGPCAPGYWATGRFQSPFGPLGPRAHSSRQVGRPCGLVQISRAERRQNRAAAWKWGWSHVSQTPSLGR